LSNESVDPIFEAGWSERTLTDVVFICTTFAFMNAIMQGHGAHDADLSDFGPIHAIIREKDSMVTQKVPLARILEL
jgi:hypothetical protein